MSADVTFRDFAGALMGGKTDEAARILTILLGLEPAPAQVAASHFQERMQTGGPDFMSKAMSLRTAVTSGDDRQLRQLLTDCFGLSGAPVDTALTALRARYHPQA